ncbi:hypothetical protein N7455_004647 [Penicillium solitum]|uniref:uncharacterized protein n=1 Tax=Penicillium solitum TaxID=60172 RepID=UPI0032C4069A|nr:hypothetical protein N7455_004647 [Penicillium solitum]
MASSISSWPLVVDKVTQGCLFDVEERYKPVSFLKPCAGVVSFLFEHPSDMLNTDGIQMHRE